jgi:putative DNA modification/repair radical SAM protein
MSLLTKLDILAAGAKYDVSCASGGSRRSRGRIGKNTPGGVCHSWSADGRCISLLKVLMSNICVYDCAYCVCRMSNDVPRAMFAPEEIASITVQFYRKNYIEGLFLSSAVTRSPDFTMEKLVRTMKILRHSSGFTGYIHVKIIPGASPELVREAGLLADRVSVNVELPTRESLALLAPQKSADAIFGPMKRVGELASEYRQARKESRKAPLFSPAGQSTQMIIGATPEPDRQVLQLSEWMYRAMSLRRVYYSAYVPVNRDRNLPAIAAPPLLREHRLYQADWLIRYYGFDCGELVDDEHPNLDQAFDPKTGWALRHLDRFPVEVNTADHEQLLRIPGIGVRSAERILALRRVKRVRFDDLKKLSVVIKRAKYFLTADGRYHGGAALEPEALRGKLLLPGQIGSREHQMDLFPAEAQRQAELAAAVTGEL